MKEGKDPLLYGVGKQCLVLATEQPEQYESIAFIEQTEEGKIRKLTISTNGKYQFKLRTFPKRKDILENVQLPERVEEPMLLRAKLLGMVENETTIEDMLEDMLKEEKKKIGRLQQTFWMH